MNDISTYADEVLLQTFAALTHRLDGIGESKQPAAVRDAASAEVRAQRDLVQAEILRRMTS